GVIRISTNPPDMQPFMTYAHSGRARVEIERASAARAPATVDVLRELPRTRHELARLLGYPTWAHYNLEERMIATPEALGRFLDEIDEIAIQSERAEVAELLAEKRLDERKATSIGEWERLYYTNRVKDRK